MLQYRHFLILGRKPVFWKAEHLLFHLETTVLCNFVFLVEKKHLVEENVELFLENASLDMSELEQYDQC